MAGARRDTVLLLGAGGAGAAVAMRCSTAASDTC